jgi:hypothetical protein
MKLQAQIKFMKIIDLDEMKIDTEHPIINTQAEIDSSADDYIMSTHLFDQIDPILDSLLPEGYEIKDRKLLVNGEIVWPGEYFLSIIAISEDTKIESITLLMPLA